MGAVGCQLLMVNCQSSMVNCGLRIADCGLGGRWVRIGAWSLSLALSGFLMELFMGQSILLVGHCGVDGPRLQRDISAALPGSEVVRVNSSADLEERLEAGR